MTFLQIPPNPSALPMLRLRRLLPPLFLLACVAVFLANALLTDRASVAFTRSARTPDTLVGIPEPRFFTDPDAYAWLCHARDMLLAGDWRIRHTRMDNAPYGRPMHWSHLLIWELAAHARILQRLHPGMLLSPAIEIAGRCAMPFFFLLFVPPLYVAFFRKLGFLPAAVFALSSALFPCFATSFNPLQPDHHVFQYIFLLVTVSSLSFGGWGRVTGNAALGDAASCRVSGGAASSRAISPPHPSSFWLRPLALPSYPSARRWFLLAGASHACLLWIGASVWLVVHVALCLAALSALAPPDPESEPAPRLWLSFLATSLPLSVAFYLLEYAPRFPGMRLEVNHPLHWLFLLGSILVLMALSSWCIARVSPTRTRPTFSSFHFSLFTFLCGVLLALPLPLALLFGPPSWHALHDPLLQRLHARHIIEFRPYLETVCRLPLQPFAFFRLFLVPLFATPFLAFWPGPGMATATRRLLRPHAVLVTAFLALTLFQQRWGTPLEAVLLPLSLILLSVALRAPQRFPRHLATALLALFFLDAVWLAAADVSNFFRISRNRSVPEDWISFDLSKRAALRLAYAASTAPDGGTWALAGLAPEAPVFYYFGGIPSLASYYWENAAGWHAEAPLLADTSASPDLSSARARSLSRILVARSSDFPELYQFVATASTDRPAAHRDTLLGRLTHAPATRPPRSFALDPALTESLSRTNLYALPCQGTNTFAPKSLPWAAFSLSPPPP